MKGFFSGFLQKRIKPISSGTVKTGKNQVEKTALEKTANLEPSTIEGYRTAFADMVGHNTIAYQ